MGAHLGTLIGVSLTIVLIFVQFPGPVQAVAVQLLDDGALENHALADAFSAVKHDMQAHAGMELAVGRRGGAVMTSGNFNVMSSGNRAGNSEDDEEELAETRVNSNGVKRILGDANSIGGDPGAAARCKNVRATYPAGHLDCPTLQTFCWVGDTSLGLKGWSPGSSKCQEYWLPGKQKSWEAGKELNCVPGMGGASTQEPGPMTKKDVPACKAHCEATAGCNCITTGGGECWLRKDCEFAGIAGHTCLPGTHAAHAHGHSGWTTYRFSRGAINCPDGGIGWEGVLMTSTAGFGNYCAAWDSVAAVHGFMECTPDQQTCTKIQVKHLHTMSKRSGVFMMKRLKCGGNSCSVFKAGRCFDVGEDVFPDTFNLNFLDTIAEKTQKWASLVVSQLKAGNAKGCAEHLKDAKLGNSGILSF